MNMGLQEGDRLHSVPRIRAVCVAILFCQHFLALAGCYGLYVFRHL